MYRRKDHFHARAKASGYRSRAAYKLIELADRYRLIRGGDRVVDLGAWPGGWLQVAGERARPDGVVVGVDLVPIDPLGGIVTTIEGDAREPLIREEILRRCGRPADIVLSDMAPKLSGVRASDEARAAELVETALATAVALLAPGGRLLLKMFMNADSERLVRAVRDEFRDVRTVRPEATRKHSAELYIIALGCLKR